MINMHNHSNTQKLVFIGAQNSEKMSFEHFIKHLKCTHYTCKLNNAWTYDANTSCILHWLYVGNAIDPHIILNYIACSDDHLLAKWSL